MHSVSNAPHRSLPDIPVSEPTPAGATLNAQLDGGSGSGGGGGVGADNGSELYATVGDKALTDKEQLDRSRK